MLRKSTVFFTLFLLLVISFSCSRTPKGVIPEKRMKHIIVDMKMAEAMVDFNSEVYNDSISRLNLYQSVFKKHGITQAQYDSSLFWYGRNLNIYMEVFDQALKEIDMQLAMSGGEVSEFISVGIEDSVNIWPYSSRTILSATDLNPILAFTIKPNTFFDGATTFEFKTKVWGIHSGLKEYPELYLCLQQSDTMTYIKETIGSDGMYQTKLSGVSGRSIQRIYGYIHKRPEPGFHKIYLDSISLMKYKAGGKLEVKELKPIE